MTSFAFILGVVPLVIASGAGSAQRHALGPRFSGNARGHGLRHLRGPRPLRDRREAAERIQRSPEPPPPPREGEVRP